MDTYVILRRHGWPSGDHLQEAAARSTQVGDEEMSDDIRWIRSYVVKEEDGGLGTVCIYQASSAEAIRMAAVRGIGIGRGSFVTGQKHESVRVGSVTCYAP